MFDIQEELKKLPQKPGVYLMKDENGHIIYVGKAVFSKQPQSDGKNTFHGAEYPRI